MCRIVSEGLVLRELKNYESDRLERLQNSGKLTPLKKAKELFKALEKAIVDEYAYDKRMSAVVIKSPQLHWELQEVVSNYFKNSDWKPTVYCYRHSKGDAIVYTW